MNQFKEKTNLFTGHPHSIGESYPQHLRYAFNSGLKLMLAGLACMIHSVFPFLFVNTASQTVKDIHQTIMNRKNTRITE
ncbi:MAG: DUF6356 family protein [Gammaproteobacteria bacterium]|nr:DUF6356 family protein [Gammaproteobacteria bacterium]